MYSELVVQILYGIGEMISVFSSQVYNGSNSEQNERNNDGNTNIKLWLDGERLLVTSIIKPYNIRKYMFYCYL